MSTPFFALLSGVAASVSATSSATLTCALLFRCPVQDLVLRLQLGFILVACLLDRSFCRQVLPHSRSAFIRMSHNIALLPGVVLASAPVPICSKIWEICFDFNTVLDDPPINFGGATRSRHCSFLGGATLTQPPACFQAMLLARATTMLSPASV